MIGTLLNAAGIVTGGLVGLWRRQPLSPANEMFFKVTLGAFTVFYGLRLTWLSLNGSFYQILRQLLIVVLALMLGRLTGRLLRLQHLSNALGRMAREQIDTAGKSLSRQNGDGFTACAALFCAAPLGLLGAVQDGLSGYVAPLAIKGVVEGLAMMGFVLLFGWQTILAVLPVVALQGSVTLACAAFLEPFLRAHGLVDPVNAVGGLLVFSVALVMLQLKKIELADYLPSLAIAPLLAWLWR